MDNAYGADNEGQGGGNVLSELYDWAEALCFSVVAVILIFSFIFRTAGVDGDSMLNTLKNRDRVIISNLIYTPTAGDIVVVNKPNFTKKPLIKRVIAVGGQEVDIDYENGIVYVDGQEIEEPYIKEPTHRKGDMTPIVVPQGQIFVMGDNRNFSTDSRSSEIGTVDERYVMGRVVFRILPFSSIGKVK